MNTSLLPPTNPICDMTGAAGRSGAAHALRTEAVVRAVVARVDDLERWIGRTTWMQVQSTGGGCRRRASADRYKWNMPAVAGSPSLPNTHVALSVLSGGGRADS